MLLLPFAGALSNLLTFMLEILKMTEEISIFNQE